MASWKDFLKDKNVINLFIISVLVLFLELLLIRWVSSEIKIFAYFKNIVLIASFMGLGLGCALAEKFERKNIGSLYVLLTMIIFAGELGLRYIIFVDSRQYYLLGRFDLTLSPEAAAFALISIIVIFFLCVDVFFVLGLRLGKLLNEFRPIVAYTINISGSLAGVLLFTALSALWLPPYIWLLFAAIGIVYFYRSKLNLILMSILLVIIIGQPVLTSPKAIWSPYYRIEIVNSGNSVFPYFLMANHDGFQIVYDIDKQLHNDFKYSHYSFIYELAEKQPENVLIVGSGMGNDVASALKYGVKDIDAVEIDPAIVALGERIHPQQPYEDGRVNTYVEDARSFFHQTDKTYDFVIFGTLDSHVVLSAFSSIRLDNYVYTYESIKEAYSLMKDDGVFAITFFATTDWLVERMYKTLKKVSGKDPVVFTTSYNNFTEHTFIVGDINREKLATFDKERLREETVKYTQSKIALTTDDWPFLFLQKPGIPFYYILPLLLLVGLSGGLIYFLLGKTESRFEWHMFFLGAAFMLLEVKAIAKLSLIFGSTWVVNSVVIATILLLILLANLLIYKYKYISYRWAYALLFVAVIVDFLVPNTFLASAGLLVRAGVGTFIACLPVFFAAIVFANSFARMEKPNVALGSNLFGAMVGGALEYISMATGIRFLSIVVLFFYLLSVAALKKYKHSSPSLPEG